MISPEAALRYFGERRIEYANQEKERIFLHGLPNGAVSGMLLRESFSKEEKRDVNDRKYDCGVLRRYRL